MLNLAHTPETSAFAKHAAPVVFLSQIGIIIDCQCQDTLGNQANYLFRFIR